MIGLVLVTHGRLAAEFVTAMEHVVGPQDAIEAICIGPDDDMEARRKDIAEAIAKVEQGQGVIILTDLFGGTPSNMRLASDSTTIADCARSACKTGQFHATGDNTIASATHCSCRNWLRCARDIAPSPAQIPQQINPRIKK